MDLKNSKKPIMQAGFVSALLFSVILVIFNVLYVVMARNPGLEFLPYLIYGLGLILAPSFILLLVALNLSTAESYRVFSLSGLCFGICYTVLVSAVYFLQLAVVMPEMLKGTGITGGMLDMGNTRSAVWAANYMGWAFMGLASVLIGLSFGTERSLRWPKGLFLAHGFFTLLAVVGYLLDSFYFQVGVLFSWVFVLPSATSILTVKFRKAMIRQLFEP